MRSIKLTSALAAAAALVCMAPAGAAAKPLKRLGHAGGICRIRIEVPKAPVNAGESVTIFGSLSCPKAPKEDGGKLVTVNEQSAGPGSHGFVQIATATTENDGAFKVTSPTLETDSVFYVTAQGAKSAHKNVKVTAPISVLPPTPAEGAQLFTGVGRGEHRNRVIFAGMVSPLDQGALVVLQRENATATEEWHRIGLGAVAANGEYSIAHTFVVPGDASIRVVVHPAKVNAPAATTPESYEISQAQKPGLEFETPTDPLAYGQSVALHGTVTGAAQHTPVTLLARPHGATGSTTVATGATAAGGTFEFTQQPTQNTLYKVSSGALTSATVFQGVQYSLSLNPPPTTGVQGQVLSFSGSVFPALSGHAVYLERQTVTRLGWNLIDIGNVAPPATPGGPGTFVIPHVFLTANTYRLRVKIPGDPGNQGKASPPFELVVTPAPASTLSPAGPFTPKLPQEGEI